ncbi:MAG: transcription-repair coupling factor [Planctomycetota bacterium]|nr:transcription-repair coupling factor [Planctomycetota bacterium]
MPRSPDAFQLAVSALQACAPVKRLCAESNKRIEIGGAWGSSAAAIVGLMGEGHGRLIALAGGVDAAETLALDLNELFPELAVHLLPVAESELEMGPERRANRSERLVAMSSLHEQGDGVLIVSAASLLEELPAPDGAKFAVQRGGTLNRDRLLESLTEAGFDRVPLVAAPGEVSVRGDIVDVYPWAAPSPVRIELFDEDVEDLRRFEVDTQRSVEVLDFVDIKLSNGEGEKLSFQELVPSETCILVVDPPRVRDRLVEVAFEAKSPPRVVDAALDQVARHPGGNLNPLDLGDADCDLSVRAIKSTYGPLETTLADWRKTGAEITVLCESEGERDRLAATLASHELGTDSGLQIQVGRLATGFAIPSGGPIVVHHHELIGRRAVRRGRPRRVVATRALDSLAELSPGDFVVHLLHGVACYRGMQRLNREQGEEDFLLLEFAEDTKLFVPASRIDLVERFIGGEAKGPKLDRIGGKTWTRKKEKVRDAVMDLASQLLTTQAKRRGCDGVSFPSDDSMVSRFERTFAFEDTPDQATAWRAVLEDMGKPRSMDRLIVGDVGFGKTEIAVRAAYVAVLSGRQAAVLVPTTILAEQHDETFRHRMSEEPIRVEVLSRLKKPSEVTAILQDAAAGKVDILIGTHRLLAKDVKFRDLGLVIVDEEQRFGVAHKEKLKALRSTVDVVTLSATPIPRTLHMAMSGLRDISKISTPPPGRRPVITRVSYESDEVIGNALRHELHRGGQVFVLHNRVQSISRMLEKIRSLVPHARTAFAHGQMPARGLRAVVDEFASGELDVLVCTSIIESGIDIPRANTIIVTDSHRFGLADMHQLRGRVGRESTQAYAFFLVPREKFSDKAQRRLKAIEEFSSLDAGLPIALRDLELRGAGNLLGAEQSGHIMSVGYDMYCRLLRSAVAQSKGRPPEEEPGEVEVDLGLSAFLPTEYIPDEAIRMSVLRRLATAGKKKAQGIEAELKDRFGPLPPPAQELLDLFNLRRYVRLAGIGSLAADGLGGMLIQVVDTVAFEKRHPFRPEQLYLITPERLRVAWPDRTTTPSSRLRYLLELFQTRSPAGSRQ